MFEKGTIWAYPTDTSFGLGVRCDDLEGLQAMYDLKERTPGKFFSLMVRDEEMLGQYAELPNIQYSIFKVSSWEEWFSQKPRTAIFKPSDELPKTKFWPEDKVAFRICPVPHILPHIEVPITATSANKSGQESFFSVNDVCLEFGDKIYIDKTIQNLSPCDPSEIWDFTQNLPKRIR